MKRTSKKKTTSKKKDDIKNEDDLKIKDDLKNKASRGGEFTLLRVSKYSRCFLLCCIFVFSSKIYQIMYV